MHASMHACMRRRTFQDSLQCFPSLPTHLLHVYVCCGGRLTTQGRQHNRVQPRSMVGCRVPTYIWAVPAKRRHDGFRSVCQLQIDVDKFNYDYHVYWGKGFLGNPTFIPLCKKSPETWPKMYHFGDFFLAFPLFLLISDRIKTWMNSI